MVIVSLRRSDLRHEICMADEAFALSPINARASLPTDGDYDAICDAFMETSRGRWFLGEYAKRNRNADTRMVLDAVERIEASMASHKQAEPVAPAEPMAEAKPQIDLWPELTKAFTRTRIEIAQRLMHETDGQAIEAIRSSVETIKSVSWALRERGFDSRICDVFDVQVNAITDGYTGLVAESSVASEIEAEVLAAFDALTRHVEALIKGDNAETEALDAVVDAVADAMNEDDDAPAMAPEYDPASALSAPETPPAIIEAPPAEIATDPDAAFHEIYGDDSDIEIVDAAPLEDKEPAAIPTEPEINKQRLYEAKLEAYRSPAAAADDIEIVDAAPVDDTPAPRPMSTPVDQHGTPAAATPPTAPGRSAGRQSARPARSNLGASLACTNLTCTSLTCTSLACTSLACTSLACASVAWAGLDCQRRDPESRRRPARSAGAVPPHESGGEGRVLYLKPLTIKQSTSRTDPHRRCRPTARWRPSCPWHSAGLSAAPRGPPLRPARPPA